MRGQSSDTLILVFDVMLVRTLTAKLPSTSPVVVSSPTPGFCQSTILRTMPFLVWLIMRPMELLFARGTEAGSRTLVAAALTGEDGDAALRDSARGAYIDSCKVAPPKKWLVEKDGIEAERRIWVRVLPSFWSSG
jgi:retinol dehydrogenase-12